MTQNLASSIASSMLKNPLFFKTPMGTKLRVVTGKCALLPTGCRRCCRTMGRVSVCDPALIHYCLEEIDHCLVVGHEPVLVFKLVEENVLAVNPDVGISNLPVHRDLSLNLVGWVVFCRAQVWFAELAVAAAASHDLDKPVS